MCEYSQFNHFSVDRHLHSFQCLATMKNAIVNIPMLMLIYWMLTTMLSKLLKKGKQVFSEQWEDVSIVYIITSRNSEQFSSVKSFSRVQLFVTQWTAAHQPSLSITNSQSLLRLKSIESVMPSNHLILLSFPSPPAFNLSQYQGLFKWVSSSHQVAKVLEFQLQHQSFQWIFRTDFL